MNDHDTEVLSALLDGEPFDPAELVAALSRPAACETLREFARLRVAVLEDQSQPSPALEPGLREIMAEARRRPALRRWLAASAAAALVATALWLGLWSDRQPQPPEPQRILRFERGVDWSSGS